MANCVEVELTTTTRIKQEINLEPGVTSASFYELLRNGDAFPLFNNDNIIIAMVDGDTVKLGTIVSSQDEIESIVYKILE